MSSASRCSDERREADQVEEQDGDEPAFGGRRGGAGRGVRSAAAGAAPSASAVPHSPQNFPAAGFGAPQAGHARASGVPHSMQNLRPASFSVPQAAQFTWRPLDGGAKPRGDVQRAGVVAGVARVRAPSARPRRTRGVGPGSVGRGIAPSGRRAEVIVPRGRRVPGQRWGVTDAEVARHYPCDDLVPAPVLELWRGVTVTVPPAAVWPWLRQVRLAPYSYDWLDNLGRRSPRELHDLPDPRPGDPFSSIGGRWDVGRTLAVEAGESLTATIMGAVMSVRPRARGHPDPAAAEDRGGARPVVPAGAGGR